MANGPFLSRRVAVALVAAASGAAIGTFFTIGPVFPIAFAQEEHSGGKKGMGGSTGETESGGATGGSHESGGCSGGSGGCADEGGAGSSGHDSSKGGEHALQGTKRGHSGHAGGVHEPGGKSGPASTAKGGADRRFGAGSGVSSLDAVPEGPSSGRQGLRYWGGYAVPSVGETGETLEAGPLSSGGGGGSGSALGINLATEVGCEGVSAKTPQSDRVSGRNLLRINRAESFLVAPGTKPETVPPFSLASLQAELQKPKPELAVVGAYLGTGAARPVTTQVVQSVTSALCVPLPVDQADEVARLAEEVRMEIALKARQASDSAVAGGDRASGDADFSAADLDHNGEISAGEWQRYMELQSRMGKQAR